MKKITAIVLVIVMVIASSITAFANPTNNDEKGLTYYINWFEEFGVNVYVISGNSGTDDSITDENYVTLEERPNGDIVAVSVEGEKQDLIVYKANGAKYINGNLIEVVSPLDNNLEMNLINIDNPDVDILGQRYNRWQTNCPYGTISEYDFASEFRVTLTLNGLVREMTALTLASEIADATVPWYSGYPETPSMSTYKQAILNDCYNMVQTAIDESIISIKGEKYLHEDGFYVNGEYISLWWFSYYRGASFDDEHNLFEMTGPLYSVIKTD